MVACTRSRTCKSEVASRTPEWKRPERARKRTFKCQESYGSLGQRKRRRKKKEVKLAIPLKTWNDIQARLMAATNLQQITQIVLCYFEKHKIEIKRENDMEDGAVPVDAKALYNVHVPRKRRIYDVLHVLEGLGVIHRQRPRGNGGGQVNRQFLYFGRNGIHERLTKIKKQVDETIASVEEEGRSKPSTDVIEFHVYEAIRNDVEAQKLPYLSGATMHLLALLFQRCSDDKISLQEASICLHNLKGKKAMKTKSKNNIDQNRRVYDVISVLASCNILKLQALPTETTDQTERPQHAARKYFSFNYKVLQNPKALVIGQGGSTVSTRQGSLNNQGAVDVLDISPSESPLSFGQWEEWIDERLNLSLDIDDELSIAGVWKENRRKKESKILSNRTSCQATRVLDFSNLSSPNEEQDSVRKSIEHSPMFGLAETSGYSAQDTESVDESMDILECFAPPIEEGCMDWSKMSCISGSEGDVWGEVDHIHEYIQAAWDLIATGK